MGIVSYAPAARSIISLIPSVKLLETLEANWGEEDHFEEQLFNNEDINAETWKYPNDDYDAFMLIAPFSGGYFSFSIKEPLCVGATRLFSNLQSLLNKNDSNNNKAGTLTDRVAVLEAQMGKIKRATDQGF